MAGRVSGKVALVTGAGSGIRRAAAEVFAAEGAAVALDVHGEAAEQTAAGITASGATPSQPAR